VCISGCASGPKFTGLSKPTHTNSIIYLYRPAAFAGGASSPTFQIDGKGSYTLQNGGYLKVITKPGVHTIKAITSWSYVFPLELTITTKPGSVNFVRHINSRTYKPGFFHGSQMGDGWTGIETVSYEQGLREIKETSLSE